MDGRMNRMDRNRAERTDRAWRVCLLGALRTLRRSACLGRPMSLPNFLRLFKRKWADVTPRDVWPLHPTPSADRGAVLLDLFYRCQQPFAGTDWRRARRWLRGVDQGV